LHFTVIVAYGFFHTGSFSGQEAVSSSGTAKETANYRCQLINNPPTIKQAFCSSSHVRRPYQRRC
jgi:hypothetical protein